MAKRTITLEVETIGLFDLLAANRSLMPTLGERLVGAMLAPVGAIDAVGLAFYGITVKDDTEEPR